MMKSLYSGVAGLKVHNQRMDVIGNNISNVNTTGFKASTVTFKDIFYQDKSQSSSGTYAKGGKNSSQVGYGAKLGAIQQVMTQSGLTNSDNVTDCALQGEGFFQVMDGAGKIYYTRNGAFHIDNVGNLCDPNGNIVLGVSGDPTNANAGTDPINLYVPPIENTKASVEKVYNDGTNEYFYTISTSNYGDEGNISVTIKGISDDEVPYATVNGKSLMINLDFNDPRFNPAAAGPTWDELKKGFQDAVNEALHAGGVELPNNMLPLNIDFMNHPPVENVPAVKASTDFTAPDKKTELWKQALGADINFTVNQAGEFGNNYEINVVGFDAQGSDAKVSAKWANNVLTIRVPYGAKTKADTAAIQEAVTAAAGGNPLKEITVASADGLVDSLAKDENKGNTFRIGFAGGKDNFFAQVAGAMGTAKLTDGRVAANQTTKDLESIYIDDDGVIFGVHAVHGTIAMGRIDVAVFENPTGLNQVGSSYWQPSPSSGDPEVKKPNSNGVGAVVSNALELSNADLSQEISDMIITQRGFQANSRVITVTDTMLEELVNLKR